MCGIAGIITSNANLDRRPFEIVQSMLNQIQHRGPDNEGVFHYGPSREKPNDENYNFTNSLTNSEIVFGHRRLSIIDLSAEAHQPMQTPDSRYTITYNGEIYNYLELKEELSKHYQFKTSSDTEVLLAAYKLWGKEMLNKLDGMYAISIFDKAANQVFCARDPMGIKPFYYTQVDGAFVYCSEPSPILRALKVPMSVDQHRVAEFLLFGISDHDQGTSYSDVKQLKGGHFLTVNLDGTASQQTKFWSAPNTIFDYSEDLIDKQKELIIQAISRQLRSDVTIGSSLSGGIDSGIIVNTAGQLLGESKHQYKTITFTSKNFESDESSNASTISRSSGIDNWNEATIEDEGSIPGLLKNLIRQIGEPFSSLSILAQNRVMSKAKELNIKVMLDGQGGDEVFLGYPRVAQYVVPYYLKKGRLDKAAKELFGLKRNASLSIKNSILGSLYFSNPGFAHRRSIKRQQPFVNLDFLKEGRTEIINNKFNSKDIFEYQTKELQQYILPRLLKYADRNSMSYSIESRVPHLSVPVIEHALQLPMNLRVNKGWTKYALRNGFSGSLPNHIMWAKEKKGFEIPQERWIKSIEPTLIKWINEAEDLGSIFNIPTIVKAIKEGQAKQPHVWRVISTILWMKDIKVNQNYD